MSELVRLVDIHPERETHYQHSLNLENELVVTLGLCSEKAAFIIELFKTLYPYLTGYDPRHSFLIRSGAAHRILAAHTNRIAQGDEKMDQILEAFYASYRHVRPDSFIPSHWNKALVDSRKPQDIDLALNLGVNVPLSTIRWALGFPAERQPGTTVTQQKNGITLSWEERQIATGQGHFASEYPVLPITHAYVGIGNDSQQVLIDMYEIPAGIHVTHDGRLGTQAACWDFFTVGEVAYEDGLFCIEYDDAACRIFAQQNAFVSGPFYGLEDTIAVALRIMFSNAILPTNGNAITRPQQLLSARNILAVQSVTFGEERHPLQFRQAEILKNKLRLVSLNAPVGFAMLANLGFMSDVVYQLLNIADFKHIAAKLAGKKKEGPIAVFDAVCKEVQDKKGRRTAKLLKPFGKTYALNTLALFDQ